MKLGLIGLGNMGHHFGNRFLAAGHDLVVFDNNLRRIIWRHRIRFKPFRRPRCNTWCFFGAEKSSQRLGWGSLRLIPTFLLGFVALSVVASMQILPSSVTQSIGGISRWMLVIAIGAAGLKTNFQELAKLGWQPVVMLVVETLFIASIGLLFILNFA